MKGLNKHSVCLVRLTASFEATRELYWSQLYAECDTRTEMSFSRLPCHTSIDDIRALKVDFTCTRPTYTVEYLRNLISNPRSSDREADTLPLRKHGKIIGQASDTRK
ncbi:hypothetical protein AVEN_227153-1 [Araneus ventricosus]|uniref:Uncharacterized protein n=1 Tax=Araneus ventricosus TaxID=182803 RepID=A0A4Y2BWG9_ARAVE|nr:hypothetical protein AVEN_227153-1 [Araneus ventricosus]